ncbi:gliding motility-associated C-terminal domain-containing protein, partial [Draconibacterium sp. IB214405]|uniref:T9SS type B sorting domain-containing protein n=1 Tax=Draconibacterium sp. IB214405 TaxID=3097352 RepID=UPI002A144B78
YEGANCAPDTVLNIKVTPEPVPIVTNETICSDESYTWTVDGVEYFGTDGDTTVHYEGANCAPDTVLNITVTPEPEPIVTNETICSDESYTWTVDGVEYFGTDGDTTVHYEGANCAPDTVLNITVTPEPEPIVTNETICSDESYTWTVDGVEYFGTEGDTTVHYEGANCAPDTVLNITVTPEPEPIVTDTTICSNETFTWDVDGVTYLGTDGDSTVQYEGANCAPDSILVLNVIQSTSSITQITQCDSYTWNDSTYTQSGTYTFETENAAGCDSIATLVLTILESGEQTLNITECESYTLNGTTYTESGTYTILSENDNGCTLTITLNLTILEPLELISDASDLTVECGAEGIDGVLENWLNTNGTTGEAEVAVGNITWTNDFESLTPGCGSTGSAIVTFTATDDCGNSVFTTAEFSIIDTTAPVIECPEDVVVSIDADDPDAIVEIPLPLVSDNCGDVTYSNDFNGTTDASGLYPLGVTTVTYTAVDECGNTDSCSFTVTVICEGQTRIDGIVYDTLTGAPLPGAMVMLIPQGETPGDIIMQITNAAGEYYFTNMVPGDYLVQVQDANLNGQGYYPTESSLFFTTIEECEFQTNDFGYELSDLAVLGDFVWYDLNGNGIQDEWYDANDDDLVTQNIPDANGYVDLAAWEWIDLNGDGSYSGPQNEGELNKAGLYGSVTTPNIHIEGPNGYVKDVIVGIIGYWRTRPGNTEDTWGTYTATLVPDAFIEAYAQQLEASGLVKILPEFKSAMLTKNGTILYDSEFVSCGATSGPKSAEINATNRVDLTLDFGIRCVETEVLRANADVLTLIYCPGGRVSGDIDLFANDEGFTRGGVSFNILTDIPEGISVTDGELVYVNEAANEAVLTLTYAVCDTFITDNCDTAEVTIHVLLDTDCDGVPDLDDIDDDDDGILDIHEQSPVNDDPSDGDIDTDGDGIVDRLDIDSDDDGIVDNIEWQQNIPEGAYSAEIFNGIDLEFDYYPPLGVDSDGDGWDDQYDEDNENIYYYPLFDMDMDEIPDHQDPDSDNDGIPDYIEGWDANEHDTVADVEWSGVDSDGDGLDDAYDTYDTRGEWLHGRNAIGSGAPLQDMAADTANNIRDWRDIYERPEVVDTFQVEGCVRNIPDGFSPNQDGYNDYFEIRFICAEGEQTFEEAYPEARIEIFNRWGNLIYEKENYGNVSRWGSTDAWWDGTSMHDMQIGKDKLPAATYFYILYLNDGSKAITGTIFLNN